MKWGLIIRNMKNSDHTTMSIAVIGAGAIGSVVAAYLTRAGKDVTLIGRLEQVDAIGKQGLHVKGARGVETIAVKILPQLDCRYDWVVMTVKTQDLGELCRQNQRFLEGSLVLSSQNGVQADQILSQFFPADNICSSIVMFGATYVKAGEVVFNFEGDWILGKVSGPIDDKTAELIETLKGAFSVIVTDNIMGMKWTKLFLNFNNCIPAVIGKSMQETFADPDLCRLSILLLKEGVGILDRNGVQLVSLPQFPAERVYGMTKMPLDQAAMIINKTLTGLSKEPLYGSILQSIMRGRPSEVDYINGQVVKMAAELNVQAPLNDKIVKMVHQVEQRKKYFSVEEIKEQFDICATNRK